MNHHTPTALIMVEKEENHDITHPQIIPPQHPAPTHPPITPDDHKKYQNVIQNQHVENQDLIIIMIIIPTATATATATAS